MRLADHAPRFIICSVAQRRQPPAGFRDSGILRVQGLLEHGHEFPLRRPVVSLARWRTWLRRPALPGHGEGARLGDDIDTNVV